MKTDNFNDCDNWILFSLSLSLLGGEVGGGGLKKGRGGWGLGE